MDLVIPMSLQHQQYSKVILKNYYLINYLADKGDGVDGKRLVKPEQ